MPFFSFLTSKALPKPSPRPSQNQCKIGSFRETPENQKNATLPYETLIFDFAKPLKIVPKWIKKRLQNPSCLGHALGTLIIEIFVRFGSQHGPRWHPKSAPKMVCKCRFTRCTSKSLPKAKTSPILSPSWPNMIPSWVHAGSRWRHFGYHSGSNAPILAASRRATIMSSSGLV